MKIRTRRIMALAAVVMLLTAALPAPAAAENLPADGNILPVEDAGLTPADPPEEPVLSGSAEGQDGSGAGQSDAGQGQSGPGQGQVGSGEGQDSSGEGLGGSGEDPDGSGGGQNSSGEGTSTPAEIQPDLEEQPGEPLVQAAPLMAPRSGSGMSAEDPLIPTKDDGLDVSGSILKGLNDEWVKRHKRENETLYIKVVVAPGITTLGDGYGGFRYGSGYHIQMDFSQADDLEVIANQAFKDATSLTGELDLSATKLTTIGKLAFSGCTGLTGVILPSTLENLGTKDGGSAFNGCSKMEYIRLADSPDDTWFELPEGLELIGRQTFKNCFVPGSGIVGTIPASVAYIGSEAFYSTAFYQLSLERESGFTGYQSNAFKYSNAGLVVFKNAAVANSEISLSTGSNYARQVYPVTLRFLDGNGDLVREDKKLYGASVAYEQDPVTGRWDKSADYLLPKAEIGTETGYDSGWQVEGNSNLLTNTSTLTGSVKDVLEVRPVQGTVVSNPTVTPEVTGGRFIGADAGVWQMEAELTDDQPISRVGVKVEHPLLPENRGTDDDYVYFKYAWWDEYENGVNGPRTETDKEIFSTSSGSTRFNRKYSEATIPISQLSHERSDGNYYMVEIFGYHVVGGGEPELFYQSWHNFIGVSQEKGAVPPSYVFNVTVTDSTNPNPPGSGPDSGSGSSSGSSRQEKKTVDLRVEVRWEGDGPHPDGVPVQLLRRGESWGDPVTLSAAGGWQYRWTRLEDADWTVAPAGTVPGYTASVERDGAYRFVITCRPAAAPSKNPDTGR